MSLATLFTDIGVHLMAFYFATSQVFEMMQPIMNAIMSCAKSKSHRVVLRTFSFWRPFVDPNNSGANVVPFVAKLSTSIKSNCF